MTHSHPFITFNILFFTPVTLVFLYNIFIYPLVSPLRHLPTASQRSLLERLFKEPNAFHFAKWINEVPDDVGWIRYFGFLNGERLLCTAPASVNQVLRLQSDKFEKQYAAKTQLKRVAGDNGLVVTEDELHKRQRKVMDPAFKLGQIKSVYYPLFWSKSAEMLEVIAEERRKDCDESQHQPQTCCMDDIIGRTVFDIIGEASLKLDWKALSSLGIYWNPLRGMRDGFAPSKDNRNRILLSFVLPTWLLNLLPMQVNQVTGKALKEVRGICRESIIAKRNQPSLTDNEKNPTDILSFAMRGHKMTFEELQDQALMLQSGGSHSSVIGLLSAVYFLAQDKDIQERLRQEIREKLPPCTLDSTINPEIFLHMPYLEAVRNEVLRLHSAFSWTGRSSKEPIRISDDMIPKGTSISISPWALHRSSKLWGNDAKEFRPERWLDVAPTVPREICSFISFGAGSRKCIGQEFAKAELTCVIAALFGRYNVTFGEKQSIPGVTHQTAVAFRQDMMVQLELVEGW